MKEILSKIKFFIKKQILLLKYKKYKKYCKKSKQREFIIFNTPIHGNLGDHAIILAEKQMLEKNNIKSFEIPTYYEKYYVEYIKKHISKDAIISITGGGFIGSQWLIEENLVNKVIKEFCKHKIIIFPQTIYFKNDEQGKKELEKSKEIFGQAIDLNIFAREEKTYKFVLDTYKKNKVFLIPDIVLSLDVNEKEYQRHGILLCLRQDVEGIFSNQDKSNLYNIIKRYDNDFKCTDTVVDYSIKIEDREKEVNKKLEEFSNAKLVITDRLHGMIFATITNTPCIVFSNYNYKVEGVYQWIKTIDNNIIFEKDISNLENDIEILLSKKIQNNSGNKYNFDKLYDILGGDKK